MFFTTEYILRVWSLGAAAAAGDQSANGADGEDRGEGLPLGHVLFLRG